jgi:hypothetical protein
VHSAFGVDHGEVSKAFGLGAVSRLGSAMGRGMSTGGQKLRVQGAKAMKEGRLTRQSAAGPPAMFRSNKANFSSKAQRQADALGRGAQAAGAAQVRTGGAMRRAGQAMQRRPGVTGGVAVGGVGAGAAGVGMSRKKQP